MENKQTGNDGNIEVSFMVPVYNGIQYTKEFLDSFNRTMKDVDCNYEMLIGDNGSTDGTRDFIQALASDKVRVFLNPENLFYGGNMNNMAKHARGKYLVLMNNDLILTPGWFSPMFEIFSKKANVGIVGNIQMIPKAETMDHMGVAFCKSGYPYHVKSSEFPKEKYTQWSVVTGACIIMLKDLFLSIGGYDNSFRNGYEDVDLCLRVKQTGAKNFTANRSIIYHYTGKSPDRSSYESENARNYISRWQEIGKHLYNQERHIHNPIWAREYLRQVKLKSKWWRISARKFLKALLYTNFNCNASYIDFFRRIKFRIEK